MNIKLSEHFTYSKLIRFTIPSILMVVFVSVYSIIDGLFVANFVGEIPFAAVNIVWPFLMILGAIGFMLGTGGNALVAKTLGEKDNIKARQIFSLLIYTTLGLGVFFAILGIIFIKPILVFFNIKGELLIECLKYGYILIPSVCLLMLQVVFQSFLVTAERQKLGLAVTILAGVINFILDIIFIVILKWGIQGAALATAVSQLIGTVIPFLYFILPNKSSLHLGMTSFNRTYLLKTCSNGLSEFMANISMAIVGILYNYQMLKFVGVDGVIAYGIISYVTFVFIAAFIGFSNGGAPIISYHYGAKNYAELKNLFHKNIILIACGGIIITAGAEISACPLAKIFIRDNEHLIQMTVQGFHIYALSFLLAGFNIFASAFFTALNNGIISASIAFLRTLVFECLCVLILPIFFGINGIWSAIVIAEILSLIVSVSLLCFFRKKYHY